MDSLLIIDTGGSSGGLYLGLVQVCVTHLLKTLAALPRGTPVAEREYQTCIKSRVSPELPPRFEVGMPREMSMINSERDPYAQYILAQ